MLCHSCKNFIKIKWKYKTENNTIKEIKKHSYCIVDRTFSINYDEKIDVLDCNRFEKE